MTTINAKEEYRSIHTQYDLPIQFTPQWMDAVCVKGNWDVALAKNGSGELTGVLVYHIRKYRGFTLILMPPMTAYNGIHIFYPSDYKVHKTISHEVKVTKELMDQLPKCSLYFQQYYPAFQNWLPFYWAGYKQTTRYTYLMDKTIGKETLKQKLKGNLRRSFNQLEKITEIRDHDYDSLYPLLVKSFEKKNKPLPYNPKAVRQLFENFKGTDRIIAKGCHHKETGELMAGVVIARDKERNYGIINFNMPDATPNGALGYLIWETMFQLDTTITDFEGWMLKEVEFYLRAFGGQLSPHYKIQKIHNPILKLAISILKPDLLV